MSVLEKVSNSRIAEFWNQARWWQKIITLLLLLLVFVIVIDLVLMPFYTRQGGEYELPDVTTMNIIGAQNILQKNGFIPIVQDSSFNDQYPPETVIQQNPFPFSTVKRGRRVYLVVSMGEKMVQMPDLVTMTMTDAENALAFLDLEVNYKHEVFSDSVWHNGKYYQTPKGTVIRQSVRPEEIISRAAKINLTLSLGPKPTSNLVPNLVGKSLDHALKELEILQISVGKIRHRVMPNLVPNTVVSQSVSAQTPVLEVSTIDLIVSSDRYDNASSDN